MAGLEDDIADIIIGDLRSNTIQKMIRRLATCRPERIWSHQMLEDTLSTIAAIREKRNRYVHWLWSAEEAQLSMKKIGLEKTASSLPSTLPIDEIRATADALAPLFIQLHLLLKTRESAGRTIKMMSEVWGFEPPSTP